MIIRQITLNNFRNHEHSRVSPGEGINLLLGRNGQGKTNVIEAVSYLGLTKSFYAASDMHVLRIGEQDFSVEGRMCADGGLESTVRVTYSEEPPCKQVLINGIHPESLSSVIGRFPVVILSPEHGSITSGGPGERRRFMDITLSQISGAYLDDLMQYRKALRHRNRLLTEYRTGQREIRTLLDPWSESLAQLGARITARRLAFVAEFRTYLANVHADLVGGSEKAEIRYKAFVELEAGTPTDEIARLMRQELQRHEPDELRRGASLVGPHRDDLEIALDTLAVQRYASQGQHKTILVAMKIAEHAYLCDRRNERPVLLLDDLFSDLDEERSRVILSKVASMGQCVITTTEDIPSNPSVDWNGYHRRFTVERGTVRPAA